jgi:hypothetical protein
MDNSCRKRYYNSYFPSAGTYKVSILPPFYGINFSFNSGDTAKLLEVQQFGEIVWSSFPIFILCEDEYYGNGYS